MRATNYKHYGKEDKSKSVKTKNSNPKTGKKVKALSYVFAFTLAAVALIIPTTTLAPNVDAFEDSKAASFSIGDIDAFSSLITENCVPETTVPTTQEPTTVAETTKAVKAKKAETKPTEEVKETQPTTVEPTEKIVEYTESNTEDNETYYQENNEVSSDYLSGYLVEISNPDSSYKPKRVNLSSYDRAKLERLVMGEAGSMGYTGCALVAQSIRDAMNRSNTTSIDTIISSYQYYASTAKEPNQSVKDAVSYIFDQNGSAVQHRILCFYTGKSDWHETQQFIVGCGNVRFFDLWN